MRRGVIALRQFWTAHRLTILHWSMEIVVVGIGVLLALSVQQWADGRASRQRSVEAERRIRDELAINSLPLVERLEIYSCLRQRLIDLGHGVASGDPRWRPPLTDSPDNELPFGRVYRLPSRNLLSDAFRNAVAAGDLYAASPDRMGKLSMLYTQLTKLQGMSAEERRLANRLAVLQFERPRTSAERAAVFETLLQLGDTNHITMLIAQQTLADMLALGFRPSRSDRAALRKSNWWPNEIAEESALYGRCVDPFAITALGPDLKDVAIQAAARQSAPVTSEGPQRP